MSDAYQQWVLTRVKIGTAVRPKMPKPPKGVKRKNLGPLPRRPSCCTESLIGKTAQKRFSMSGPQLEGELLRMRKAGVVMCTDGEWWVR